MHLNLHLYLYLYLNLHLHLHLHPHLHLHQHFCTCTCTSTCTCLIQEGLVKARDNVVDKAGEKVLVQARNEEGWSSRSKEPFVFSTPRQAACPAAHLSPSLTDQ